MFKEKLFLEMFSVAIKKQFFTMVFSQLISFSSEPSKLSVCK